MASTWYRLPNAKWKKMEEVNEFFVSRFLNCCVFGYIFIGEGNRSSYRGSKNVD